MQCTCSFPKSSPRCIGCQAVGEAPQGSPFGDLVLETGGFGRIPKKPKKVMTSTNQGVGMNDSSI